MKFPALIPTRVTPEPHPANAGLVIGNLAMEAKGVGVRVHNQGNLGTKPRDELLAELLNAIRSRSSN